MGSLAAFFDVDGTITRSDIFRDHLEFRFAQRPGLHSAPWLALAPLRAAWLLALDRIDRGSSNRSVYRLYRGFRQEELSRWAVERQARSALKRTHPRAIELLRRHAEAGHRLVFLTGSLLELAEPLARLLEPLLGESVQVRVEAASLESGPQGFTGELLGAPLAGEEKARRARRIAEEEGLDLSASHAYGDSFADLEVLELVGKPAAVNPDDRLRRLARRRGWPVLDLAKDS